MLKTPRIARAESAIADLFDEKVDVFLPPQFCISGRVHKNLIQQIGVPERKVSAQASEFSIRSISGFDFLLEGGQKVRCISRKTSADLGRDPIILTPEAATLPDIQATLETRQARWMQPRPADPGALTLEESRARARAVVESWRAHFDFREEGFNADGRPVGLRAPQIGALYATLAHWSVGDDPATIVMPTGTGKTETMLAVVARTGVERLIVVVPNAALRDQIAGKFLTLGVLKAAECLDVEALHPIVATLEHRPQSPAEVEEIFGRVNVVVTTMSVAGQCSPDVQASMADWATHLFVDEAHHLAARTWTEFRSYFIDRRTRVLQFTATPFRTDGKRVDGKFIYVYPLARAQREGYFKPVRFAGIHGIDQDEIDRSIIDRVGAILAEDRRNGWDHLVIARVDRIRRAEAIHALYAARFPQHAPVFVHSKMSSSAKKEALARLASRASRIVVCADMLGEGFDLPELKIAALHDRHKSIAITLQFTGRITRARADLGDATVVANISQDDVEDALRSLYAEDADWNFLLSVLSEGQTSRQQRRAEILSGFSEKLQDIPLQVLFPRMNTVVFRTQCADWEWTKVDEALPPAAIHAGPIFNASRQLALFITRDEEPVRWGDLKQVINTEWNLYLMHWDDEQELLYINSSKTGDLHDHIAKAVCGESVERLSGDDIFRALYGFNRLVLTNLGLSHPLGRYVRYTQFMGADITEQLSDAATQGKRKSNIFGQGFADGEKATIGCSAKGKIWSHQIAHDFSEWLDWCRGIGAKVLDESITTDDIIRNLVKPYKVAARPDQPPIAIQWPESFLEQFEDRIAITIGAATRGFHDCDIELVNNEAEGPLLFRVMAGGASATFEVLIDGEQYSYPQRDGAGTAQARIGTRTKTLSEWFKEDPPHVHFASGDFLVFNELFQLPRDGTRSPFDANKIDSWNWKGIDIRRESQGVEKDPTSVQRHVIEQLLSGSDTYEIIFDDDGAGEIADVVAIRRIDKTLRVDLFHCKFSSGDQPGHRLRDLYEVCGQAQKCVRWRQHPHRLFRHIMKRDKDRRDAGHATRFELGSSALTNNLANRWREFRFEYRMFIVQPGLRKNAATEQQLDLLAATESYLLDTYAIPLRVIAS